MARARSRNMSADIQSSLILPVHGSPQAWTLEPCRNQARWKGLAGMVVPSSAVVRVRGRPALPNNCRALPFSPCPGGVAEPGRGAAERNVGNWPQGPQVLRGLALRGLV